MLLGNMEVEIAEPGLRCDSCTRTALLVIDGQAQCAQDAGTRLQAEPEVFADLVAGVLRAIGPRVPGLIGTAV